MPPSQEHISIRIDFFSGYVYNLMHLIRLITTDNGEQGLELTQVAWIDSAALRCILRCLFNKCFRPFSNTPMTFWKLQQKGLIS